MVTLTAAALIVLSAACEQPGDKDGVLRELSLTVPYKGPFATATTPTKIASAEEAEKILPGEPHLKQFNFTQEYILLFAWKGSGQDKLSYRIEKGNDPAVVFTFVGGKTKDLRTHIRLYAIAKNASWRFEKAKRPG
jgi:hypothetical protein